MHCSRRDGSSGLSNADLVKKMSEGEETVLEFTTDSGPLDKHGKGAKVEVFSREGDVWKEHKGATTDEQRENNMSAMAVFGLLLIAFYSLT